MLTIEEFALDHVNGSAYSSIPGKVRFNDPSLLKYVNFVVIVLLGNMVARNSNTSLALWDLRAVCIEREWQTS